jgi:hypothetical protein
MGGHSVGIIEYIFKARISISYDSGDLIYFRIILAGYQCNDCFNLRLFHTRVPSGWLYYGLDV